MSYRLNKTDGSLLVDLIDGRLDTDTTDIALIGKNYQGFGESINENFIKLLETFANSTPPEKPIKGQLWFDTTVNRLKAYNGTEFKSTDSSIISGTQPVLTEGDIWIDNTNKQLYFFDGNDLTLVGPNYTNSQLKTGFFPLTVKDNTGKNKIILKLFINGIGVALVTKEAFVLAAESLQSGFDLTLKAGINIGTAFSTFAFNGKSLSAEKIINSAGEEFNENSFLRTSGTGTAKTQLPFHIENDGTYATDSAPLSVGIDKDFKVLIRTKDVFLRNNTEDGDLSLQVNVGGTTTDAVFVDTQNEYVGIFNSSPQSTLHIGTGTGDHVIIEGNLTVKGENTSLDVSRLRVEDHQIELAIKDDSSLPTDAEVDDAGIVVRVSGDDKRWTWRQLTDSWTSSHSINVDDINFGYKIFENDVLTYDTLGSTVVNSSLTSVGTLGNLQVDNININGSTITESAANLNLVTSGNVDVGGSKITDVATPTTGTDATNKAYVDQQIQAVKKITGLNIDGLGSSYATGTWLGGGDQTLLTNIATILDELDSASGKADGTTVAIHAVKQTATISAIDVDSAIITSTVPVDAGGTLNETVVSSVNIDNGLITSTISFSQTRFTITMEVAGNSWDATTGVIASSAV